MNECKYYLKRIWLPKKHFIRREGSKIKSRTIQKHDMICVSDEGEIMTQGALNAKVIQCRGDIMSGKLVIDVMQGDNERTIEIQ